MRRTSEPCIRHDNVHTVHITSQNALWDHMVQVHQSNTADQQTCMPPSQPYLVKNSRCGGPILGQLVLQPSRGLSSQNALHGCQTLVPHPLNRNGSILGPIHPIYHACNVALQCTVPIETSEHQGPVTHCSCRPGKPICRDRVHVLLATTNCSPLPAPCCKAVFRIEHPPYDVQALGE